jgi:glutamate synthase (NADPH/NADH) small chain
MGNPKGFLTVQRHKAKDAPITERVKGWREFTAPPAREELAQQASRCMDCGIPFCHQGCPLGNLIPEWNDLVYRGEFAEAASRLFATNNFPEITGRVCPAPCEASCVLNIEEQPVTIKDIERAIADDALAHASPASQRHARHAKTGKRIAIVGSGPAGLAAADELAKHGHSVTVFERDARIGGLCRYGIPDFKLEKGLLDTRVAEMSARGVDFKTGVDVGVDITAGQLLESFDAVLLALGARVPRDLSVAGRELAGVHYAMDFLSQQNDRVAGVAPCKGDASKEITAKGKRVIVIGGGDTGSDCVGTSIRQGAASVTQLELMPKPSLVRLPENPWPEWPLIFRTSSSQEEGCDRDFGVMTTRLVATSDGTRVAGLEAVRAQLKGGKIEPQPGSELTIPADLVLLAMGFLGPEKLGIVEDLGVALDARGNVVSDAQGRTSVPRVFAAGDASRGQSLVVWAIADGRRAAAGIHASLHQK